MRTSSDHQIIFATTIEISKESLIMKNNKRVTLNKNANMFRWGPITKIRDLNMAYRNVAISVSFINLVIKIKQ